MRGAKYTWPGLILGVVLLSILLFCWVAEFRRRGSYWLTIRQTLDKPYRLLARGGETTEVRGNALAAATRIRARSGPPEEPPMLVRALVGPGPKYRGVYDGLMFEGAGSGANVTHVAFVFVDARGRTVELRYAKEQWHDPILPPGGFSLVDWVDPNTITEGAGSAGDSPITIDGDTLPEKQASGVKVISLPRSTEISVGLILSSGEYTNFVRLVPLRNPNFRPGALQTEEQAPHSADR